jgi:hypothetical protein
VQRLNEMGECTKTKWRCSVAQRHEDFPISLGKTCFWPVADVTVEKGAAPADWKYEVVDDEQRSAAILSDLIEAPRPIGVRGVLYSA